MATKIIGGLIAGGLFGAGLVRGGVHLPSVIQDQMLFRDFTMMKMFLTALSVSAASMWLTHRVKPKNLPEPRSIQDQMIIPGVLYSGNIIGGAVMGAGMVIGGTCPGTVYAQIGGGVANALWALTGGLLGAYLYSIYDNNFYHRTSFEAPTLQSSWKLSRPTTYASISIAAASAVAVLYVLTPSTPAPIIGGLLVGASQLVTLLSASIPLGMSASFVVVLGTITSSIKPLRGGYLSKFTGADKDWWAVSTAVGAVVGSYLASTGSSSSGAAWLTAILGGAMVVFGARMAGGCTSGHGITGISTSSFSSIITVAATFGGGMIFARFF
ncbi:hypothetical protein PROFUN_02049 [Planoprotostelium fungivorum]|uniref:Uncharacterized protein n=1 Tax=Planoprotostelium fungivorum TaxID=1890364 RepID=A0A2P6NB79_9EUKA|nr:hypothetical protein PROFUN_02049 [Planoprotostelium fungivorum]